MGSWGVKAHESDRGLDYLGLIETNIIKPSNYKHFDIAASLEYLRNHIITGIRRENRGCSEKQMQKFIDFNLPIGFGDAVMMIAECLDEYFQTGEYSVYDYDEDIERTITKFIYTPGDLEMLVKELRKILDPSHEIYNSWAEPECLEEWLEHMEGLCERLGLQATRDDSGKVLYDLGGGADNE